MPELLTLQPQQEIELEFYWRGVSSGKYSAYVDSVTDRELVVEIPMEENGREVTVQLTSKVTVSFIDGEEMGWFDSTVAAKRCDATTMYKPYLVIPRSAETCRRTYPRMPYTGDVRCKLVDVGDRYGSDFVAHVEDISVGGMRILARRPLRPGWGVDVELDFDGRLILGKCRVVHVVDRDLMAPKRVSAGLEFTEVRESDRVTIGRAVGRWLAARPA